MERGVETSNRRHMGREVAQCIHCSESRGVVQWCEIAQLFELRSYGAIHHGGTCEPGPPMDHSVANRVEWSGRSQELTQVIFERVTRRVAVDGLAHTIVAVDDT